MKTSGASAAMTLGLLAFVITAGAPSCFVDAQDVLRTAALRVRVEGISPGAAALEVAVLFDSAAADIRRLDGPPRAVDVYFLRLAARPLRVRAVAANGSGAPIQCREVPAGSGSVLVVSLEGAPGTCDAMPPDGGGAADGGLVEDAGLAADAGATADGGVAPDGGIESDGGGTLVDGGVVNPMEDGGAATEDAGTEQDAGVAADGGGSASPDGGAGIDAGTPPDAGADLDGGRRPDGGALVDGGHSCIDGCARPECEGSVCGSFGRVCADGMCQCSRGTVELSCSDGIDNDCNGASDCADAACEGLPCGVGRFCQAGSCS